MMRVVLDTNVIVSGVVGIRRRESVPGQILRLFHAKRIEVITSDVLLAEVERTLSLDYFAQRTERWDRAKTLDTFREEGIKTTVTVNVEGVASHPEDDLILATALSAHVDYLVTGDKQLLARDGYEGLRIVSPRDFLGLFEGTA
ncbi:MAG: putative toxin-antitoxin system toxin component, PIN family [Thermomicrobiales bacterium]